MQQKLPLQPSCAQTAQIGQKHLEKMLFPQPSSALCWYDTVLTTVGAAGLGLLAACRETLRFEDAALFIAIREAKDSSESPDDSLHSHLLSLSLASPAASASSRRAWSSALHPASLSPRLLSSAFSSATVAMRWGAESGARRSIDARTCALE